MNSTIDYIFRHLRITEDNTKAVIKALKAQYKFNQNIVAFSVLTATSLLIFMKNVRDNQKEIEKLKKRLNEIELKALEEELKQFSYKEGE